jgi:membrane-bound inhibitor of C-type lysozyme
MKKIKITKRGSAVVSFLIFVLATLVFVLNSSRESLKDQSTNTVVFACAENKSIQSSFFEDSVSLSLGDGRIISLRHVVSGSGARYINSDESFIFWNKGESAFFEEKNVMTYKDCLITKVER